MDIETKRLHIHGIVQGVGYRHWASLKAKEMRLTGWIRNLSSDKSVEAVVTGTDMDVQKFISACYEGPQSAQVKAIHINDGIDEEYDNFEILDTL